MYTGEIAIEVKIEASDPDDVMEYYFTGNGQMQHCMWYLLALLFLFHAIITISDCLFEVSK